jgi:hypothetical protein
MLKLRMRESMGYRVAAEESKPGASQPPLPENAGKETLERMDKLRNSSGPLSTAQIRGKMQKAMQADAAVFRTQVNRIPFITHECAFRQKVFEDFYYVLDCRIWMVFASALYFPPITCSQTSISVCVWGEEGGVIRVSFLLTGQSRYMLHIRSVRRVRTHRNPSGYKSSPAYRRLFPLIEFEQSILTVNQSRTSRSPTQIFVN